MKHVEDRSSLWTFVVLFVHFVGNGSFHAWVAGVPHQGHQDFTTIHEVVRFRQLREGATGAVLSFPKAPSSVSGATLA